MCVVRAVGNGLLAQRTDRFGHRPVASKFRIALWTSLLYWTAFSHFHCRRLSAECGGGMMLRAAAGPFLPVLLFSVLLTVVYCVYLLLGATPSATFEVLVAFLWSLLLPLWVVRDARNRGVVTCYDFGMFVYMFLPLSVPCYCLWSRGWRGVATVGKVLAAWFVPYLVPTVVWVLLHD